MNKFVIQEILKMLNKADVAELKGILNFLFDIKKSHVDFMLEFQSAVHIRGHHIDSQERS